MKKLWSIPLITVYLYIATVLTTVGYFDYFGVPSYFVEASIQSNVIYFFSLLNLTSAIFSAMRWWTLLIVIVVAIFIFLFYHSARWRRWLVTAVGTLILCWALFHSFSFGKTLARYNTTYLVPATGCASFGTSTQYIGMGAFEGKEIFIPVDPATRKLQGGFMLKDLSEASCVFEHRNFGQILK